VKEYVKKYAIEKDKNSGNNENKKEKENDQEKKENADNTEIDGEKEDSISELSVASLDDDGEEEI
jgi:hypothetical protein